MQNLLAFIIVMVTIYLIANVISRKKRELKEKENIQRERFLQESQSLLKIETPIKVNPTPLPEKEANHTYRLFVAEYFTSQGYTISEYAHNNGIDFIGIKEKELIMIRCDSGDKEIREYTIKEFIADCTLHIEKNPMLSNRSVKRVYVTPKTLNDPETSNFIHANPQSVQLLSLRMSAG